MGARAAHAAREPLNRGAILSKVPFGIRRCGEEMLVITNPATQAAADQFALGKRAQGMRTNVFQVGSGAGQIGTTPAQIQAFIRARLTARLCIHPSYVTIIGDDDLVPTFTDYNGSRRISSTRSGPMPTSCPTSRSAASSATTRRRSPRR